MSEGFFVGWQLWEQMTFVLAGAIVLVFCLGWAKLWWATRQHKRQVVMDEEKSIKIQQLRASGVIIKLDQQNHVPFGVRALQSGVEIDGIWVSKTKTKLPDSLKLLQNSDYNSHSSIFSNDDGRSLSLRDLSPPKIPFSGSLEPAYKSTRVLIEPHKTIDAFRPFIIRPSSKDSTYKPRRSSHLRFSSSGDSQVNQEALSRLESVDLEAPKRALHEDNTFEQVAALDLFSDIAADSEHSSSSDSDSSLGGRESVAKIYQPIRRGSLRAVNERSSSDRNRRTQGSNDISICDRITKKGDYFSIAPHSHPQSKTDAFATPEASSDFELLNMRKITQLLPDDNENFGKFPQSSSFERPLLSLTKPIFTPGSIHVNKMARKINPGFEILPAGTFSSISSPVQSVPGGPMASTEPIEDKKRQSKKLQKRGCDSVTGKRVSAEPGNN